MNVIQDTNCINTTMDSETSITMLLCLSMISTFSLCFLHVIQKCNINYQAVYIMIWA